MPLSDVRVLEMTEGRSAVGLCGRILADLGADVLMVEPPDGIHERRPVACPDRADQANGLEIVAAGKRSCLLDLAEGEAAWTTLRKVIVEADVLLLDRASYRLLGDCGLDVRGLRDLAPHLVVCCHTPYGLTGPLADVPAAELTVQAHTAVLMTNGYRDDPPVRAGIPIARCAGAALGLVAVLAALREQRRTGRGDFVDQGEYDALVAFLGTLLPSHFLNGGPFSRIGNHHTMSAPWNAYRTKDGWVVLSTIGQEQWRKVLAVIDRRELGDDSRFVDAERRVRHNAELDAVIEQWSSARSTETVMREMTAVGLPVSPVGDIGRILSDPHAKARAVIACSEGRITLGPVLRLSDTQARHGETTPRLGSSGPCWPTRRASRPVDARETSDEGPLRGLRILEIGMYTAGPLATRLLGLLGAEVVKIEPLHGEGSRRLAQQVDGTGYLYHLNNTDKYGCTIALDTAAGREQLLELARRSDALVTNLATETLSDLGLDATSVRAVNPRLVYCAITGYGLTGPYAGRKAFDTVVQAVSGVMGLTGLADSPPLKVAMSVADLLGGCFGAAGTLAALLARDETGRGQVVDAALFDAAVWATQESWPRLFAGDETVARWGNRHPDFCPHNCFHANDGHVAVVVENNEQWRSLVRVLGVPELADDPRYAAASQRLARVQEVEDIVAAAMSELSADDVVRSCWRVGVPAAVPLDLAGLARHPQTKQRGLIVQGRRLGGGSIDLIGCPFTFARSQVRMRRQAPQLGEHNDEFLDSY